jgi:nucleoside-diphosphate-sugar epimerase
MYFGENTLPKNNPKLTVIRGDIRSTEKLREALYGVDTVLHLACVSNDPSFDLDAELSVSANFECFEPMVIAAKEAGVKRFVYCSTSSVYGISDALDITEDHPLVPLTLYNKYKGLCEPLLFKHMSDDFECVVLRPATVCGYSPRMRLDLSVNILTNHAYNRRKITVFGGKQLRPNLNIKDMVAAYCVFLEAPKDKIHGEIFNIGYQNRSISDIADIVKNVVEREFPEKAPIGIETTPSDDNRSYHINSDKIRQVLAFEPQHTIEDAVVDICENFRNGTLPNSFDDDKYFNVKLMKAIRAQ